MKQPEHSDQPESGNRVRWSAPVRHQQFQIPTDAGSSDAQPNQMPYEVLLRHHYPTVSALLESAEKQDESEWVDWSESKRIFLPVLLSLWKQLGRPEIRWPIMPHLPALNVCSCVLNSYWVGMGWAKMPNDQAQRPGTNNAVAATETQKPGSLERNG